MGGVVLALLHSLSSSRWAHVHTAAAELLPSQSSKIEALPRRRPAARFQACFQDRVARRPELHGRFQLPPRAAAAAMPPREHLRRQCYPLYLLRTVTVRPPLLPPLEPPPRQQMCAQFGVDMPRSTRAHHGRLSSGAPSG
jgi:hypothetical protein